MRTTLVAIVILLALAAAACGGSDQSPTATSQTTPAISGSPPSKSPSADQVAAAETAARSVVLTLADLPTGWTPKTPTPKDTNTLGLTGECQKFDTQDYVPSPGEIAHVEGTEFGGPLDQEVSSNTAVFTDEQSVVDALDEFDRIVSLCGTQIEQGLKALVRSKFAQSGIGSALDDVRIAFSPMSFDSFGNQTRAYHMEFNVRAIGIPFDLNLDFVLVKSGRIGVDFSYTYTVGTALGTPITQEAALEEERMFAGKLAEKASTATRSLPD